METTMDSTRPELDSYHRKRNFELTPEPEGAVEEPQPDMQARRLPTAEKEASTKDPRTGIVVEGVAIKSPYKKMFGPTGPTKEDVAHYYAQTAQRMLPYVSNRILSIVRCPAGARLSCFHRKHPGSADKAVTPLRVAGNDGEPEEYFYLDSTAGLVSEAQMDTLEFHVWGSRIDSLEKPDSMVFDLDPDEDLGLDAVRLEQILQG